MSLQVVWMDAGDWTAASGDATRQNDELSLGGETVHVTHRGFLCGYGCEVVVIG